MISCNLVGGLGNMMFQIAAGYSHSLTVREDFGVSYSNMSQMIHTPFTGYEDNIFRNIKVRSQDHRRGYSEPGFCYTRIPELRNIILSGYYQSEKYFIDHKKEIKNLFAPSKEINDSLANKYGNVSDHTSLHIRRGDYLQLPTHHPTCTIDYYHKALANFDGKVLVFSDDIDWCRKTFQDSRFEFVEGNLDYEDLHLMSMCKNNIIANSSFSWWGAWLNDTPNKVVIAPKIWFGSAISHNTKDLLPQSWITI
jgi:hypothetical protein